MMQAPRPDSLPALGLMEGGLTAIAVALAFCWPRFGSTWTPLIERAFAQLARRRRLAVVVVGVTELLFRLAMLPWFPIPLPTITDEFSYLLAADTFASGRLTNPTPAMWIHFETMHVTMKPTYMSMFFPAYGLILAAGKVLFGHPWFGLLLTTALLCAAMCWMLQAWLPPTWSLLGGLLVVLQIGLFSYWINTYTGGGTIAALGGTLVLGALPRIARTMRVRDGLWLAIGILILANSRPYEGGLLCIAALVFLVRWWMVGKNRPAPVALLRCSALPLVVLIAGGLWMAYYNYRNFGNPLTLPYTVNRATYAVAPHFLWESENPVPEYRFKAMRDYYVEGELPEFRRVHSRSGFIPQTLLKGLSAFLFYVGFALAPPLIMLRRVALDRRMRFLILCMALIAAGVTVEASIRPYYMAPFMAAFYAILLQAMRHLRLWRPEGKPVGIAMLRLLACVCVAMVTFNLWRELKYPGSVMAFAPPIDCRGECTGSLQQGLERSRVLKLLESFPGNQLVIVRYSDRHRSNNEWVYNAPDIDASKVIWAREMDAKSNQELIDHYKDRHVWLVQPDAGPVVAIRYGYGVQSRTNTP